MLTHGVWRFGGGSVPGESRVFLLAFPLLVGPGAVTSVIISYQATGFDVTILSIAIVIGITCINLLLVNPIYRLLGRSGSMNYLIYWIEVNRNFYENTIRANEQWQKAIWYPLLKAGNPSQRETVKIE